ncbi:MAG: lysoplasmalogenase [Anaerovoracaceae bacterium]|jgi:uncharacterized membrane protein YhhN
MDSKKKQLILYTTLKTAVSLGAILAAVLSHLDGSAHPGFPIVLLGLICCTSGDFFLALSGELYREVDQRFFVVGVVSFAAAHLLFCWYLFVQAGSLSWTLIASPLTFLAAFAFVKKGVLDPGALTVPVLIYSALVGAFLGFGLGLPVVLGATAYTVRFAVASVLFWASDLILSFRTFHPGSPKWLSAGVLIAYFAATYLIAFTSGMPL